MSRYADFGTSQRHWLVETCNEDKRRTFKVLEKKKKLHGARPKEYDGCGKTVIFSDFTSSDAYDGKLS